MTLETHCVFCSKDERESIIAENDLAHARWDKYPVSLGHAEVITNRHVQSFFELTREEVVAVHALARIVRDRIMRDFKPDSFNIGVNDGPAAGQTIHHHHMHIIPRYTGDVANPRGGVRHVITGRGDY